MACNYKNISDFSQINDENLIFFIVSWLLLRSEPSGGSSFEEEVKVKVFVLGTRTSVFISSRLGDCYQTKMNDLKNCIRTDREKKILIDLDRR